MNTKMTGAFALAVFFYTGMLLAQQGRPIICNNHEPRTGACVPNRGCDPATPTPADPGDPGDPKAKPPVPPRPPRPAVPCGGFAIQINKEILQCQGGVPGGHCRDIDTVHCADKAHCIQMRDGDRVYCGYLGANATGISGWYTQIESIPCVTRKPLKTERVESPF
jgi:hypothetical protein